MLNTPLSSLSPGWYRFPKKLPYYAQFASPELIYAYVHENFDGRNDPRWRDYGTEDVEEYLFWHRRACGIACLKMCLEALTTQPQFPTMIELIRKGVDLGGYIVHNEQGEFVDFGWYYQPLVKLGEDYGLHGHVCRTLTTDEMCTYLAAGSLVIASVSYEIGERDADMPITKRGGHLVLVHGFEWSEQGCQALLVHNPSGRFSDLQANAVIPFDRFSEAFAGRGFVFESSSQDT
ncbi:MAG TPA: C39 family peptidase [Ktedonobacteraceae bacterium]|nr:C39 family peptidase [Ktedonobacteraceae bacterium]